MTVLDKAVVLSDIHVPYHDKPLTKQILQAVKDLAPKIVFLDGDVMDCYAISRFTKPLSMTHASFKKEIAETKQFLRDLRAAAPKAEIYYVEGNHEYRLRKLIEEQTERQRYEWLDDYISIEKILDLDLLSINYIKHSGTVGAMRVQWGDTLIGHWQVHRGSPGGTAKHLMDRYAGLKVIQGHVHKAAVLYQKRGPITTWGIENPCMCPIDNVEYTLDPSWQQGFTVLYNYQDTIHPNIIVVEQKTRTFVVEGKLYKVGKTPTKRRFKSIKV